MFVLPTLRLGCYIGNQVFEYTRTHGKGVTSLVDIEKKVG